ncbi:MAG: helix-turn-helix domain-containing protein [Bacteroidales bacterium]
MGSLEEMLETLKNIEEKLDSRQSEEQPKGCFKVSEAADFLGISAEKVYELINDRKIGYVKIGRRKLIPKAEAVNYIKENTKKPLDDKEFKNNISMMGR